MKQVNLMLEDNNIEVYINGDSTRNIVFNPSAVGFIDKYIKLVDFANNAQNDPKYSSIKVELPEDVSDFDNTVSALKVGLDSFTLFFNDLCERVDDLFGKGASEKACQGVVDIDIIINLISGLAHHINIAQADRVGKYTAPYQKKQTKKK